VAVSDIFVFPYTFQELGKVFTYFLRIVFLYPSTFLLQHSHPAFAVRWTLQSYM